MEAAYSPDRDERMNAKWGERDKPEGYIPNDGYYELDPENYRSSDFPLAYEGKLIKCLWGGLLRLPPDTDYRIIFMRRKVEEIRRSLIAFFGRPHPYASRHDFDEQMERIINITRDRRSVKTLDVIYFDEVVKTPLEVFTRLDWPINFVEASRDTRPEKKRQYA